MMSMLLLPVTVATLLIGLHTDRREHKIKHVLLVVANEGFILYFNKTRNRMHTHSMKHIIVLYMKCVAVSRAFLLYTLDVSAPTLCFSLKVKLAAMTLLTFCKFVSMH
jgi:hypothetical protein